MDTPKPIAEWVFGMNIMEPNGNYAFWHNTYHFDFRQMQEYARNFQQDDGWTVLGAMIARDPISIPIIRRPIHRIILP